MALLSCKDRMRMNQNVRDQSTPMEFERYYLSPSPFSLNSYLTASDLADTDECSVGNPCGNGTCKNVIGGFECTPVRRDLSLGQ